MAVSDGRACKTYYYYFFSKFQKARVLQGEKLSQIKQRQASN